MVALFIDDDISNPNINSILYLENKYFFISPPLPIDVSSIFKDLLPITVEFSTYRSTGRTPLLNPDFSVNNESSIEKKYDLSPDAIKENLYRKENPNAYLATFSKFLIENKDYHVFKKIIYNGLNRFIGHQIMQFDNCRNIPIHFVGSVAHYLKDEIKELLIEKGMKIGNIVQRPIDNLVKYHIKLLK